MKDILEILSKTESAKVISKEINFTDYVALGIRWYDFSCAMKASATQNLLSFMATNPTMYSAVKNAVEYGKTHGNKNKKIN